MTEESHKNWENTRCLGQNSNPSPPEHYNSTCQGTVTQFS